jgi:hypothetical protein
VHAPHGVPSFPDPTKGPGGEGLSINQIRREEAKAGVRLGADDRLTADDQVDKRSVQTICLGTGPRSDEYLGRDVQRQLLGRPVELKATAGLPAESRAFSREDALVDALFQGPAW